MAVGRTPDKKVYRHKTAVSLRYQSYLIVIISVIFLCVKSFMGIKCKYVQNIYFWN
jgi:hypothetical protein